MSEISFNSIFDGVSLALGALFSALSKAIVTHLNDKDNPHEITPEQIGAVAAALLGKPGGPGQGRPPDFRPVGRDHRRRV